MLVYQVNQYGPHCMEMKVATPGMGPRFSWEILTVLGDQHTHTNAQRRERENEEVSVGPSFRLSVHNVRVRVYRCTSFHFRLRHLLQLSRYSQDTPAAN